jgi:hypothetical protein
LILGKDLPFFPKQRGQAQDDEMNNNASKMEWQGQHLLQKAADNSQDYYVCYDQHYILL